MNKIKVGFLAVVAIVAMSFTLVSNGENTKSDNTLIANCYTLEYTSVPLECEFIAPASCDKTIVGLPVRNIAVEPSTLCQVNGNFFCCATLEVSSTQICNQPRLDFTNYLGQGQTQQWAKIKEVFCRVN